jgi:hypothetical protein
MNISEFETDVVACAVGIKRFSRAMREKLERKRKAGRAGWNRPQECSVAELRSMMMEHVAKGDLVDVANFAMMIWNRENPNAASE